MSDDNMSQSQVESLLRAMQVRAKSAPGDGDAGAVATGARPPDSARSVEAGQTLRTEPVVAPYDFRHRPPLGAEQMRNVRARHETIAPPFAGAASGLLRTVVQCRLLSASQRSYGEFISELERPSCLHLLSADPLEGSWLLEITPALAFPVVDRLLGGEPEPSSVLRRELTEIETRLLRRLVNLFLTQLTQAWQTVAPLQLAVERVESDPRLALLASPSEAVMVTTWEVSLDRSRGLMNLCIPATSITGLERDRVSQGAKDRPELQPTDATRQVMASSVQQASVELTVTLARSKIRTAELLDLAVGDVITTEQEVGAALELSVQGTPRFFARPGAFRGRKAVCIQGLIQP